MLPPSAPAIPVKRGEACKPEKAFPGKRVLQQGVKTHNLRKDVVTAKIILSDSIFSKKKTAASFIILQLPRFMDPSFFAAELRASGMVTGGN